MKKKILIGVLLSFLISGGHVLAAPSPAVCPKAITCSYSTGCKNVNEWTVDGQAVQKFSGTKTFPLFGIFASAASTTAKDITYWFYCSYGSPDSYIRLIAVPYTLQGDWDYTGFAKTSAKCKTINPSDCIGILAK